MPISAVDAISPAFQHAKQQLLQPFRFSQWVRLALVGFLAGELGSGGGCNSSFNLPSSHHQRGTEQFLGAAWPSQFADHPAMLVGLIASLIVVGLGLFVLFIYINSVMRFILFDSIVAKECHIRQGWVRRQPHGRRFFVWQILLMLVSFAALVLLIGVPVAFAWAVGWFDHPGQHLLPLVLGGVLLFFLFLALVVVLAVVHVMTKDFVVPQMALEDLSAFEGWRRLWLWLKAEKGGYAGYIGVKIGLAIAAGIALAIITLIVFLMLLIPIGGVGVAAVLAWKAAGLTWDIYTLSLAVVAGCIVLALLIFVFSLISVPVIVFFPAYSIYFLAPRYPALAALLTPPPPDSAAPGSPAADAPPLPFTPAPLG
ncbi:MAG TPA: hypothetical protein VFB10_01260 [Candidatus Dormibacteraeota bacterium]|nr:hypothetical protein [Acidobacteriota bacterium]HYW65308.1 hypothetical protein [Candidatus Dormibacteraeota bacterium]